MEKYSVVIPSLANKTTYPYLKLCVESLRESGFKGNIIVVTNGTTYKPNLTDIFGITVHLHTRLQGQCNAVNTGMQLIPPDHKYALVSNDDMVYVDGWDKNLRFDYLCFSPNLIEPENNAGSAPPFLKLDAGNTVEEFDQDKVEKLVNNPRKEKPEAGFNLPFFIRMDVWRTIQGYDTAYDPWGSSSDTDLQMKVELAGIKPMRLKDVLVYHFSNKSGTFDGTHQDFWQENWNYLQNKWGFNRDEAKSDTWYCENMILWDKLKYEPDWVNKYAS